VRSNDPAIAQLHSCIRLSRDVAGMRSLPGTTGASFSDDPLVVLPYSRSQTRIVPSCEPDATSLSSDENETERTKLVCPSNGPAMALPVFTSQTRIVWSSDPETMYRPSDENAALRTKPICPLNGPTMASPSFAFQTILPTRCVDCRVKKRLGGCDRCG